MQGGSALIININPRIAEARFLLPPACPAGWWRIYFSKQLFGGIKN
jgi:hypothetical protein